MAENVQNAMKENRPEKLSIRKLWIDEIKFIADNFPDSNNPWYLTLPGELGLDIELIIEEEIIKVTEINTIAEEYQDKIVAVERSNSAVLKLQQSFVGLKIIEKNFSDLLKGVRFFSWPNKDEKELCKSHIINLDLNNSLKSRKDGTRIIFPVIEWIYKLCVIHAEAPPLNWTLCLTLRGNVSWDEDALKFALRFLKNNFDEDEDFMKTCKIFLGKKVFDLVDGQELSIISDLDFSEQQKFLMIFVPKYISKRVTPDGWQVSTTKNLRYGGDSNKNAPMVTWVIKFSYDHSNVAISNKVYKKSLNEILTEAGYITGKGNIQQ